ncbi:MAG TPA: hypothetical protein VH325_12405 [Bryobacteraceae bacterium]|nr:hypothetical protein [Bryobacteraceae bacterium]
MTSQTFTGVITNKGNDTGSGTFTNSSGVTGPISLETNLVLTPTSEDLNLDRSYNTDNPGFGPPKSPFQTQLYIIQTLVDSSPYDPSDPNNNKFEGRQVFESANGQSSDGCYQAAQKLGQTYPGPSAAIQGTVWNVGGYGGTNSYGDDILGWTTNAIKWYRQHLLASSFPCTVTIPQAINIVSTSAGASGFLYDTHTITYTLTLDDVTISKDGIEEQNDY